MSKRDPKSKRKQAPKKGFDCVKTKRRIQAKIYQEIKGLTREQELEYWRKGAENGPWGDWWKRIHARSRGSSARSSAGNSRRRKSG
jgi:hypothetical protein